MANFLSLPVEVREIIYGYVWCQRHFVRFGHDVTERSWTTHPEIEGPRYPEKPSATYPPAASKDEVEALGSKPPPLPTSSKNKKGKKKKSAAKVIEFDVQEFLNDNSDWWGDEFLREDDSDEDEWVDSDGEDEDDEDYDSEDDYDFEEDYDSDDDEPKRKKRYKLDCFTKVNISLFYVNRQIYRESWPIFYKAKCFVFDTSGLDAIRFLNTLPPHIQSTVASIGLPSFIFMGDDRGSRVAWSGTKEEPKYLKNGLQLNTPFAAFLATKMPGLQEVYYYTPFGGDEDFYASWAPTELGMLLTYGRIKRLCHVFFGEHGKKSLEKLDSKACHKQFMDILASGYKLATYRYELKEPSPKYFCDALCEWMDRSEKWAEENRRMFPWEWADRDVDFGSDGNVQAVIACTR